MKIKLPRKRNLTISVGQDILNKPEAKTKTLGSLGAFLEIGSKKLSNEKSASEKLIDSCAGWVYINSSVLAENVSKLELKLYQVGYKQGTLDLQEIYTHPILDLLDRFNDSTTSSDGFYLTETHLNLTGNSFWYTPIQNGQPTNIFILRPDKVHINLQDFNRTEDSMIQSYLYKDTINGKPVQVTYTPDQIIPFKVPNEGNMFRGKSTVEAIANDIDIDNFSGKTIREFFENGMIVQMALSTDQRINNDQIANYQAQLRSAFGGAKNAWKVPVFGGGLKPTEIQMTNKDSQLIENMKWYRDKIMIAFKNTPASLGIIEDVNRANSESTLNNWKQSTIKPKMCRIVDSLNEYLVPKFGDNLILGFENPVPEDDTTDRADAINLFKGGLITQNEARNIIGYDQVADGDTFYTTASPFDQILPKAVKNVNYKAVFRRNGIFKDYEEYRRKFVKTMPTAKKMLEAKKIKPPVLEKSEQPEEPKELSLKDKYAQQQLKMVDHHEQIFSNQVKQLIDALVNEGITNITNPVARKTGNLVNKEKFIEESIAKLEPVLIKVVTDAGQKAMKLIHSHQVYVPKSQTDNKQKGFSLFDGVRDSIAKFMGSAADTSVDKMSNIIADGLSNELSVPEISKNVKDTFTDFSKSQTDRITRTEVIKASNLGAQDAFEQSGIVEAKEWLTTDDDRTDEECLEMDGKIIGLDDSYFSQGDSIGSLSLDYEDVDYPPLHPNCRCVLLPVIQEDHPGFHLTPLGEEGSLELESEANDAELNVFRGEGNNTEAPGSAVFGDTLYVARNRAEAAQYGDVHKLTLPFGNDYIFKINSEQQYEDFIKNMEAWAFKSGHELDYATAIPAYVRYLGFKGIEANEDIIPNSGIAVVDKKVVRQLMQELGRKEISYTPLADNRLAEMEKLKKKLEEAKEKELEDKAYIKALEKYTDDGQAGKT